MLQTRSMAALLQNLRVATQVSLEIAHAHLCSGAILSASVSNGRLGSQVLAAQGIIHNFAINEAPYLAVSPGFRTKLRSQLIPVSKARYTGTNCLL